MVFGGERKAEGGGFKPAGLELSWPLALNSGPSARKPAGMLNRRVDGSQSRQETQGPRSISRDGEVLIQTTGLHDFRDAPLDVADDEPAVTSVELAVNHDQLTQSGAGDELDDVHADREPLALVVVDERHEFVRHLFDVVFFRQLRTGEPRDNGIAVAFNRNECRLKLAQRHGSPLPVERDPEVPR